MLPTSVVAVKVGVVSLVMPSAFEKPVSEDALTDRPLGGEFDVFSVKE